MEDASGVRLRKTNSAFQLARRAQRNRGLGNLEKMFVQCEGDYKRDAAKPWNKYHATIFELDKRILHDECLGEMPSMMVYDLKFKDG